MPTTARARAPQQCSAAPPRGRRVLVVDDDRAIRELFGAVLRRADFHVAVAERAAIALRSITDSKPDVVILDLAMPRVDGFAVIACLRALPSPPPVVVVSGAAYPEEMLSFGRPVVAFLAKPVHPGDLVVACERALSRPRRRRRAHVIGEPRDR